MTSDDDWGSEALRRAALLALGDLADERAVDALRHARIAIAPGAGRWQSSTGPVHAHGVTLGVDAARLGALRASPATVDALCAAVAAAIAQRPGETLLELSFRWTPDASMVAAGYRDAPAPPIPMRQALVDYLKAAGKEFLAGIVEAASVTPEFPLLEAAEHRVRLRLDRTQRYSLKADADAIRALTRAVCDLLGDERAHLELT